MNKPNRITQGAQVEDEVLQETRLNRESYLSWLAQGAGSGIATPPPSQWEVSASTPSPRWDQAGHSGRKDYNSRRAARPG